MNAERIILMGGGQHAKVVLDCLLSGGANVVGLFDTRYPEGELFGVPQLGGYQKEFDPHALMIISVGDNAFRYKASQESAHAFTNAIHSSVQLASSAIIGTGNMILHGAIIQQEVRVGNHCIVNTGAAIEMGSLLGNYCHVAPGAIVCRGVSLGEGVFVAAGAIVLPGVKIGAWSTVGAGAVVTEDVPAYAVAVGNPSRIVKRQQA